MMNGLVRGNKDGEYTFTRKRGNTVIDYVVGDEKVSEKIRRLEVGEGVELDQCPVIVIIEGEDQGLRIR